MVEGENGMFLDPVRERSGSVPNIGRLTSICLAFPLIDKVLLVHEHLVLEMH